MQIFENIDEQTFKLNGLKYVKNFMIIPTGIDTISIINAFDTKQQILGGVNYSQISVDGVVYGSQILLMDVLVPILFYKQALPSSTNYNTLFDSQINF